MLWLLLCLAFAQDVPAASSAAAMPVAETMPTTGTFGSNKTALTADGEQRVAMWAELALANPGWVFEVGVHTDSQGSERYNQAMSQNRAESVANAMIERGVPWDTLVAKGYGESRPIAPNTTLEGRGQNRRVELRKLRPVAGNPSSNRASKATEKPAIEPSIAKPTASNRASKTPTSWQGFSPEFKGVLGSGDERREGKVQIDSFSIDVPFNATFQAYSYHSHDNDPTAKLVGPAGQIVSLAPGKNTVQLSEGRWTIEMHDHKKAVGPWGLRLNGISSVNQPDASADTCVMLNYLVAQSHVRMSGAAGREVDSNFREGPSVPGLPGKAVVHHTKEYWLRLYEGPDEAAATSAWDAAKGAIQRCLTSRWNTEGGEWMTKSYTFKPELTWDEREMSMRQPMTGGAVLVKLQEQHRESASETTLYIYRTDK